MVVQRDGGVRAHARFEDLARWLRPRSLLVVNDTRVLPARLVGRKPTGGRLEVLLLRRDPAPGAVPRAAEESAAAIATGEAWSEEWEVLARDLGSLAPGGRVAFGADLDAVVMARGDAGHARLRFIGRSGGGLVDLASRVGSVPLPHYIEAARRRAARKKDAAGRGPEDEAALDRERYQTVYARWPGSVAAPTAGLHFTDELLAALEAGGHEIARLTLHVGPGTFRPVQHADAREHRIDAESYDIPSETAGAVERAWAAGRPVVAVGTTVVRAIEAAAVGSGGRLAPGGGWTDLVLLPGARFHVVTDLVTNFHLPRSSLLMLVAAFAGRERVLGAYREAIRIGYRFYSYGDAMFIRGMESAAPGGGA